jgi:hypothetical protein
MQAQPSDLKMSLYLSSMTPSQRTQHLGHSLAELQQPVNEDMVFGQHHSALKIRYLFRILVI